MFFTSEAIDALLQNYLFLSLRQICRLGKHTPIAKTVRDGILRVGKSTVQKLTSTVNGSSKQQQQPIDEWFKLLGDNQVGECLRLYAQVCNHRLAPYLTQVIQDRSLFDSAEIVSASSKQNQSSSNVSETMPATPDGTPNKPESVGKCELPFPMAPQG
jgi:mediator of RNA polymerase II transcription subunit 13